jgi:hypothetical protein
MITLSTLLGSDSISTSRLVINDNLSVIEDEINAMETYFNPSNATLINMTSITTDALKIGLSSTRLEISASLFNLIGNPQINGNLSVNGQIYRNSVNTTTLTASAPSFDIGSLVAVPPKTIYRVSNATGSAITFKVFDGEIGQELFFMCEPTTSAVLIEADATSTFVLTGAATKVSLGAVGQTVHLLCIGDASNNPEWVVVGGNGYTLV